MHLYDLADFEESKDRDKWKEGKFLASGELLHILKSPKNPRKKNQRIKREEVKKLK